jgi:hypothetical protein
VVSARGFIKGILRLLRSATGMSVLAVVPLFLVFANTQIKELIDSFLGGCTFVIDKRMSANGAQVLVTARMAGTPPKALPLMFQGRDALINTVFFDEPYRQERIVEPDDLAFHPMTGSICPGDLCPELGAQPLRRNAQIVLHDLRPEFSYRFRVRLKPEQGSPNVHQLKIYATFDAGLPDGICKVQPRRWFNFWVWATPLQKAFLFLAMVVIGGLLLRWAQSKPEGEPK